MSWLGLLFDCVWELVMALFSWRPKKHGDSHGGRTGYLFPLIILVATVAAIWIAL